MTGVIARASDGRYHQATVDVEAVILTGGGSRRMGKDKASLTLAGVGLAERVAREFDQIGIPVTVLGQEPIAGRGFLKDEEALQGPASALSRLRPTAKAVFVCSCDLPRFSARCVAPLLAALAGHEAAVPVVAGRAQFLCAAYASSVFEEWSGLVATAGVRSMRELVRVLECAYLDEDWLEKNGLEPGWFLGVNTPEELEAAKEREA
jgi:molybdopterin-guanine dinucleotide biosynthesis protein A